MDWHPQTREVTYLCTFDEPKHTRDSEHPHHVDAHPCLDEQPDDGHDRHHKVELVPVVVQIPGAMATGKGGDQFGLNQWELRAHIPTYPPTTPQQTRHSRLEAIGDYLQHSLHRKHDDEENVDTGQHIRPSETWWGAWNTTNGGGCVGMTQALVYIVCAGRCVWGGCIGWAHCAAWCYCARTPGSGCCAPWP